MPRDDSPAAGPCVISMPTADECRYRMSVSLPLRPLDRPIVVEPWLQITAHAEDGEVTCSAGIRIHRPEEEE